MLDALPCDLRDGRETSCTGVCAVRVVRVDLLRDVCEGCGGDPNKTCC